MSKEKLFNQVKDLTVQLRSASTIIQNDVPVTEEQVENFTNSVYEITEQIKNWHAQVLEILLDDISPLDEVKIYSDGGCRMKNNVKGNTIGDKDICAYAFRVEVDGQVVEKGKATYGMTNNQMELRGFCAVLYWLDKHNLNDRKIVAHLDSKYVLDGINSWLEGWKAKGWRTANKKPVKNQEEWQALDNLIEKFPRIEYVWVKGHADNEGNNAVDKLLNDKMDELERA